MKKIAPFVILFLFCLLVWNVFAHSSGMSIDIDGEEIDGPLGAVLGLLFAGGGIIIAALVVLFVGAVLAVVFAGVGVLLALGLGLAALVLAAAGLAAAAAAADPGRHHLVLHEPLAPQPHARRRRRLSLPQMPSISRIANTIGRPEAITRRAAAPWSYGTRK